MIVHRHRGLYESDWLIPYSQAAYSLRGTFDVFFDEAAKAISVCDFL